MDELFLILSRGEMPDFIQVLQALSEISDINWDRAEDEQLSIRDVLKAHRVPNTPHFQHGEFCDVCG